MESPSYDIFGPPRYVWTSPILYIWVYGTLPHDWVQVVCLGQEHTDAVVCPFQSLISDAQMSICSINYVAINNFHLLAKLISARYLHQHITIFFLL